MKPTPCPRCRDNGRDRKGDNLKPFPDGGAYCFACGYHTQGDNQTTERRAPIRLTGLEYKALPHRKITEDTCRKYNYRVAEDGEEVASYPTGGDKPSYHVRITKPSKDFVWSGGTAGIKLWGQHLFDGKKNRRLYITEGEIDCMTVYQVFGNREAVVSFPSGATSAKRYLLENLEFIESFNEVILVFDADKAGQEASDECAPLIRPGKCKVAALQYKDPNAYLKEGKLRELVEDLQNAQTYRPRDIVHVSDVHRDDTDRVVYPYPWDFLDLKMLGREQGELIGIFAGTSVGKSTTVRTMMRADLDAGYTVGGLMLEETTEHTIDELIGLDLGKNVPRIFRARAIKKMKPHLDLDVVDNLTDEEYRASKKTLEDLPLYLYDSSEMDPEALLARMNYLCVGLGCTHLYFDHLTIATAGGDDERKDIDNLMRNLRELAIRTGAVIHVVTQLTSTEGKSYEEGATISINKARGSRTIGQTLNSAFSLERNQQDDNEDSRNTTTVRVLKSRGAGETGIAGHLYYDPATGRQRDKRDHLGVGMKGATIHV